MILKKTQYSSFSRIYTSYTHGYGKYFYCICRHPPTRPRATQTDMALPWEAQGAALLKIQEDHIGQQIIRQRMPQVQLRSKCLSRSSGGANSQRSWSTQRSINISLACKGARCMQIDESWSGIWGIAMKLGKLQVLGDKRAIVFKTSAVWEKCVIICVYISI